MKHVIVLNQFALPRTEGGGTRHVDLFGRLEGWVPIIVAGSRNHYSQEPFDSDDATLKLVRVPSQSGGALPRLAGWVTYSAQAFFVVVTRPRVDVVYGSSPHLLAPLAGLLAARCRRVPFVLEIRDLWPESFVAAGQLRRGSLIHRGFLALEKVVCSQAAAVVVVTPGWEDHFARLGVSGERLVVVSNGTEPCESAASPARHGVRLRAIFTGAHGPKDGLDYILDAAAAVPEIDVVLVGDGASKAAAVRRAREEKLGNVTFLEPVPKQELPTLLATADIGIHAVTPLSVFARGMSPNKLFDYMAAGIPVVSNAGDGVTRIVRDGECGRIGGPDDLAACLRSVAQTDADERARWGARGREIVTERYSRSGAAARLGALLTQVTHTAGGQSQEVRHEVAHLSTAHRADDNRILRKECVALNEAGLDVCLIARNDGDQQIDGVPVIALPTRSGRIGRMILGPMDAWRILRRVRPLIVHVHDPELVPLALVWRCGRGRKAIYDAHEDLPKQVMGKPYIPAQFRTTVARFARLLERAADTGLDAIVAATPSIARNFNNPNTTLVQNFPWLRAFPVPQDPCPEGPATITYVGGITRERGGLEMITGVHGSRHHAQLVLAGPATEQMVTLMDEHKSNGVRYLGQLPVTEVPGLVADSRVGLVLFHPLPNHLESQPTKLFEYMAAGRPFIASNFPYWQTLLGQTHCGYFIDPLDPAALSAAIDVVLDDPEGAADLGRAGRRAVEQTFSFEREAPRLVEITKQLLSDS